jgi:hypothetical protein
VATAKDAQHQFVGDVDAQLMSKLRTRPAETKRTSILEPQHSQRICHYTSMVNLLLLALAVTARGMPQPGAFQVQTLAPGIKVTAPVKLKVDPKPDVVPSMSSIANWMGDGPDANFVVEICTLKDPTKLDTSEVFSATLAQFSEPDGVKIVGVRDILLNGWPGYAASLSSPSGLTMACRVFRVNERLVLMSAAYAGDQRPTSVDKFLNSLKIDDIGTQTVPGPDLKRFPLGKSGMTALFPRTPEVTESKIGAGASRGTMFVYASDYALRSFEVAYRDMPDGTLSSDLLGETRKYVSTDTLRSLHGKQVDQKEAPIGDETGLWTDFTLPEGSKGIVLAYFHAKKMIMVVEFAPHGYDDPTTVNAFLRSIQFAP